MRYSDNSSEQCCYSGMSSGNVLGEGSVFFVVESKEHARERGVDFKFFIKDVIMRSVPGIPATYKLKKNPLAWCFKDLQFSLNNSLSYIAGEGDCSIQEQEYEIAALTDYFPNESLTSAASYFGYTTSVTPFYNLLLFYLGKKNKCVYGLIPSQKAREYYGYKLIKGVKTDTVLDGRDVIVETVSTGGTGGVIVAHG